jgi:hypothetical protein
MKRLRLLGVEFLVIGTRRSRATSTPATTIDDRMIDDRVIYDRMIG